MTSERLATVIGATGLIGSEVAARLADTYDYHIITPSSKELNIRNPESIEAFMQVYRQGAIFNCGAYTNTRIQTKEEQDMAWDLNVEAVRHLAEACIRHRRFFIHASTDYIKNGREDNRGPYTEDVRPDYEGLGYYAYTKAVAEDLLPEYGRQGLRYAVVRFSYPYGNSKLFKNDYLEKTVARIRDNGRFIVDHFHTPVLIEDIMEGVRSIAEEELEGTFHIAPPDVTTPFEFAAYVAYLIGYQGEIRQMNLAELNGNTIPQHSGLNAQKTQEIIKKRFHATQEGLNKAVTGSRILSPR